MEFITLCLLKVACPSWHSDRSCLVALNANTMMIVLMRIDKGNDLMLAQLWVGVLGLSGSEMLMCPKVRLPKKLE